MCVRKSNIVFRGSRKFAYSFCNIFTIPCAKILLRHALGVKTASEETIFNLKISAQLYCIVLLLNLCANQQRIDYPRQ